MKFIVLTLAVLASLGASYAQYNADTISVVPIEGGLNGTGITTRYWDCCKPSCAWAATTDDSPVAACEADGVTKIANVSADSGCANGTAYACNDQQSIVLNETFALGFAAASFVGGVDVSMCCSCMLLSFEGELEGKQYLIQITNTGSDLDSNQFDLAMPGGGVGIFNGCSSQWGAPDEGWGERYGGVTSESGCDDLPDVLKEGCKFRFEWMNGVGNPNVTFVQVECPAQLTRITGCVAH